jgi:hypothetical protein
MNNIFIRLCTFPPPSCHFISPRPKYSPPHPVSNHPQSQFSPIQNHRKNYTFVYCICLSHYATSRKASGSIPEEVSYIYIYISDSKFHRVQFNFCMGMRIKLIVHVTLYTHSLSFPSLIDCKVHILLHNFGPPHSYVMFLLFCL